MVVSMNARKRHPRGMHAGLRARRAGASLSRQVAARERVREAAEARSAAESALAVAAVDAFDVGVSIRELGADVGASRSAISRLLGNQG